MLKTQAVQSNPRDLLQVTHQFSPRISTRDCPLSRTVGRRSLFILARVASRYRRTHKLCNSGFGSGNTRLQTSLHELDQYLGVVQINSLKFVNQCNPHHTLRQLRSTRGRFACRSCKGVSLNPGQTTFGRVIIAGCARAKNSSCSVPRIM